MTTPSTTVSPVPPVTPPAGGITPPLTTPGPDAPAACCRRPVTARCLIKFAKTAACSPFGCPTKAKVTINGIQTKSTGSRRQFVSYGLPVPVLSYSYEVVAKVVREGKEYTDSKTIALTAGGRGGVGFGFNITPAPTESQTASN